MASPIKVIMNAGSGSSEDKNESKKQLEEAFLANNLDAHFSVAESGEQLLEMAEEAAKGDYQTIVAAGGDGTISAVAAAIAETGKTLGVLPFGTLNHFSKDLNISSELEESVRIIAENNVAEIDIGEVNGQVFINNSSIGLYPQIVRRREKQQNILGRGKWVAAFWAALAVMRRYPFLKIRLTIDGKEFTRKTPFVFVGNNEYEMDSFNIGGRKCLDAGSLSVYVLHRTGRMGLVRLAVRSVFGVLRQAQDFETFCTDEIIIETRHKKLLVAFDGEVKPMETPLRYRIRPNALRVIVPMQEKSEK
jgi:diacylglycerol kinase family enzyme